MAVFPSFKLTEKGEELLNRSIGEGKTLTFTKFELGDGNPPSDFRKQTGLVNKFYEFPILNTSIQKDQVLRIRGYFDNKSFSQDKQLKEIGVFVKIEGNETQYLYSYTNAGDTGDIIPSNSRGFYSRTLDVANYIGYATNITFNIEQLRDRYAFNTENEMKVASYLKAGDKVELWGNVALGDSSFKMYIITDQAQPIQLNNKLYAKEYFAIVNDLTTGGADKALSAEMGKKLNNDKQDKTDSGLKTNKKNVIDAINSSLNMKERPASFDGTFIDFYNKFKIGSYSIPRETGYFDKFGFPDGTYNYGVLTVYETVQGALRIDFYADEHREKLTTTIFQFGSVQTSPEWQSKTFKDNVKWNLQLTDKSKLFLGTSGISSVTYIQDAGEKTAGNGYVDKITGQLYLCKTTNSDITVTNNFVLATNIEIAKRQHFTKTILFDKPAGHRNGDITLSDNWENYDEFIVYGSSDNADYVGSHRFKKEDIEYSISKDQRYMIYGEANDYWLARITTGSKTWASGDKWENCVIFRIIGIKYGG